MSETAFDEPVRVPLPAVVASIAGLWLCYFVLTSIRSAIGLELQGELLWRRALVCLAGIAITQSKSAFMVLGLMAGLALWARGLRRVRIGLAALAAVAIGTGSRAERRQRRE